MPAPIIDLDLEEFGQRCQALGLTTNRQIAEAVGVDPSTVSRVRAGRQAPGTRFIDGSLALFGNAAYSKLFRRRAEVAS